MGGGGSGGKCTNSENPSIGECFRELLLNAIPPKQHDGRTQAGTSSHMCTVPSPPLPHLQQRPRDTRWQPCFDGYKSQGGLGQEYKISLEQECEELGLEPEFFQQPSDEAPAFLALNSCLKSWSLLLTSRAWEVQGSLEPREYIVEKQQQRLSRN